MSIDSFLLIVNTRIAVIAADHRQHSTVSSLYFNSLFWQPTSICYCFVKFTVLLSLQDNAVLHALAIDTYTLWCRHRKAHSCIGDRVLNYVNGMKSNSDFLFTRNLQ